MAVDVSETRLVPITHSQRCYLGRFGFHTKPGRIASAYDEAKPYREAIEEVASIISWWLDQAPGFDTGVVAGAILRQLGVPEDVEA